MFARALLVLLLVLNLGVAAWWIGRPAAAPAPPPRAPAGIPSLHLLGEAPPTPAAPASAGAPRCVALGPFAGEAAAVASRVALRDWGATSVRVRAPEDAARGWNVAMPPMPDQAAAQALAGRIRAAGFGDLLVMPSGEGGHVVALGRYGSEGSARQRVAVLRAAGFEAQASPVIDPAATRWLDAVVPAGRDVLEAQRVAAAPSAQAVDCATIVDGARDAPR